MSDDRPFAVIKGSATPEEVAAVLVALRSRQSGSAARRARSLWSLPARQVRPMLSAGPGAWRASSLPR